MPQAPQDGDANKAAPLGVERDAEDLAELRRLLLGREQQKLDELERRLEAARLDARKVARVLPEAVAQSTSEGDKLGVVLAPTLERAIDTSVRREPQKLVAAISPVMGPAIRRAIVQALRNLVESLNRALKHSLSLRGLKWRWEALRTGKPFAEVVLVHTLLYRVEQVFLIHRETGLLLRHEVAESSAVRDEDMFSAMLTAIQDFIRDSVSADDGAGIETLQMGELTVWLQQGPLAGIAAVVRGNPPGEVRELLETAVETIHLELADALADFDGDTAAFGAAEPHLRACLAEAQRDVETRRRSPLLWLIPAVLLLALGFWAVRSYLERARWDGLLESLRAEPGIMVTECGREGGRYFVRGLRDPLSRDPREIATDSGVSPDEVDFRWKPYQACEPGFVLRRARGILEPPDSVELALRDGVLTAAGQAGADWIAAARARARLIPGVERYDDGRLVSADRWARLLARAKAALAPPPSVKLSIRDGVLGASGSAPHAWIVTARRKAASLDGLVRYDDDALADETLAAVEAAKRRVEDHRVQFPLGSSRLVPAEQRRLIDLAGDMLRLEKAAVALGRSLRFELTGHTDSVGTPEVNEALSLERAQQVLAALAACGVDREKMRAIGMGATQPLHSEATEAGRSANRRVSFRVVLSRAAGGARR